MGTFLIEGNQHPHVFHSNDLIEGASFPLMFLWQFITLMGILNWL